jgi:hypothetical protein
MKTYVDPCFLDLDTSWRWVVSSTPLGKSPRYPLDRRQCASEPVRKTEKWKCLPYRDSNSDPLIVQPVASRYTDYAVTAVFMTWSSTKHSDNFTFEEVKVNLFLCLINRALRHEGVWGSGDMSPAFLTSALDRGEWSASDSAWFTPVERYEVGWTPEPVWMLWSSERDPLLLSQIEPWSSSRSSPE